MKAPYTTPVLRELGRLQPGATLSGTREQQAAMAALAVRHASEMGGEREPEPEGMTP